VFRSSGESLLEIVVFHSKVLKNSILIMLTALIRI
jgi:hypothetical protein